MEIPPKYSADRVVGGFSPNQLESSENLIPLTLRRTYLEHRQIRAILRKVSRDVWFRAAEFGCGYGRNLALLKEFFSVVHGYERDEGLALMASWLNPECIVYNEVPTRGPIDEPDFLFDLVMTFTFLQHLSDSELVWAGREIHRTLKLGGYALIVEETDTKLNDLGEYPVRGRSPERYASMLGLKLIESEERKLEPGNENRVGGHYLLMRKER